MSARRTKAQEHDLVRRAAIAALESPERWLEEIGRRMMRERASGFAAGLLFAAFLTAAITAVGALPRVTQWLAVTLLVLSVAWKVIWTVIERAVYGPRS